MKKMIAVLLGTAFALTACGGNTDPAPTKTVYVQPDGGSTGESQQSVTDREFLHDIDLYSNAELRAQPADDLISLGHTICMAFDEGASLQDVVRVSVSSEHGLSQESIITVAAAAVVNFCPEHNNSGGIGA